MTRPIELRIKWASLLVAVGLLVELLSLMVLHPLSFMAFLGIGVPLIGAGIVLYLLGLVSHDGAA